MFSVCSKVTAGCFALAAFAVAIVAGLAADLDAAQILWRATLAMLICYPAGLVVGMIFQHIIDAHIHVHKAAHPLPDQSNVAPVQPPRAETPDEEPIVV